MKSHLRSAFLFAFLAFGCYHAYVSISRFGFEAVDLPPIKFFFFSLWSCVRNITTYTLAVVSIVYLLGKWSRWVLTFLVGYIAIVWSASLYASHMFHANLAEIWIMLLMNSSVDELLSFARMTITVKSVLAVMGIVMVIGLFNYMMKKANYPKMCKRSMLIGIALLLPFVVCNLVVLNWHWGVAQMPYTSFLITSVKSWASLRGVYNACDRPNLPTVIPIRVEQKYLPDVVIVLGESVTRNNWHLYGYGRQTTPRLDQICSQGGGIAYTDVVGVMPDTVSALTRLLTDVGFENPNDGNWTLAEVYRRAGYKTTLITNQGSWDGSLLAKMYNGCDKRIDMYVEYPRADHYDETVVPYLKKELSNDGPHAIFVHLQGVHYPVQDVNPSNENYFSNDVDVDVLNGLSEVNRDRRNRYDNGLLYGDKVLGMIVDSLKQRAQAAVMYFVSDHGESPRSDGWRIYSDKDVYELPCVIWFSSAYRERFPETVNAATIAKDRPMQQDEMTYGLLDIAQIAPFGKYEATKSFLHERFAARNPRYIDKGRLTYSDVK